MQTFLDAVVFQAVLITVVNQLIWMLMTRRGRENYVSDLTHFRPPSSSLSKYYGWRVSSMSNVFGEGILFHIILISTIIGLSFVNGVQNELAGAAPILVLIVGLSVLTALQMTWRVKKVKDKENEIMFVLNATEYKIERAKEIVDRLYTEGAGADGQIWFALFQIAQRRGPIGYSVRDVLIEKGKQVVKEDMYRRGIDEQSSTEPGPGIA
ncbi:MAG: hypothetical protein RTU30_08575 [Candidatus Thorarchaeota archaeon]